MTEKDSDEERNKSRKAAAVRHLFRTVLRSRQAPAGQAVPAQSRICRVQGMSSRRLVMSARPERAGGQSLSALCSGMNKLQA